MFQGKFQGPPIEMIPLPFQNLLVRMGMVVWVPLMGGPGVPTYVRVPEKIIKKIPTLPETNIAHENPIFPGKYHPNGGFSMAMLVSGSAIVP